MKIHSAILLLAIALSGRAATALASPDEKSKAFSICELSKSASLIEGKVVRITATYETDKSHYSYLVDPRCGRAGVLNISNVGLSPDESVRNFFDSGDERCAKEGTPYLCTLSANVDAEIKITRDEDGKPAAELLKVYEFSFENPGSENN
jgi:hypothetical protein